MAFGSQKCLQVFGAQVLATFKILKNLENDFSLRSQSPAFSMEFGAQGVGGVSRGHIRCNASYFASLSIVNLGVICKKQRLIENHNGFELDRRSSVQGCISVLYTRGLVSSGADQHMSYLDCPIAIRDRFAQYRQSQCLWLDTEVADCRTPRPRLSLIQVATEPDADNAVVLDVLAQPELVEEFIATIMTDRAIEKVFHNASFDLRFLGKERAQHVTCTLKLARSLPKELLPVENHKLKTLVEYMVPGADVDKSEQASDWGQRPLRASQLHYAKMDVVYLGLVHQGLLAVQSLVQLSAAAPGDIKQISSRYRALEETLKPLLAERDRLKEQLQTLMMAQSLTETEDYS